MPEKTPLQLADFVDALRTELRRAITDRDEEMPLLVQGVTVELSVQATSADSFKGGIRFWVVDAGAESQAERGTTQRITLTLMPSEQDGSPISIHDTE